MSKRSKKQRRIRAVDDDDGRPQTHNKSAKSRKKQSNFTSDLVDTSRTNTKRLRYEANQVQRGKAPGFGKEKGSGPGFGKERGKGPGFGKGKGKVGGKPKGKTFGKPQAPKKGGKRK